jgi:hypothetical protein
LLTKHWFSKEIAALPKNEIERLRAMLDEAVMQRIEPEEIYDAITRGFELSFGSSVSSPPLACDVNPPAKSKEEALIALVQELEEMF